MIDAELALAIQEEVAELNELLARASRSGLKVQLRVDNATLVGVDDLDSHVPRRFKVEVGIDSIIRQLI